MLTGEFMINEPEHDPTRAQLRQARVASRLADALNQKGLQVAYQPEFDLETRRIVSFEALCRWKDDELGIVSPDEFIAVAEARGLVIPLGQYMLDQVLTDLPAILLRCPQARVAVNVSGVELALRDFAARTVAVIYCGATVTHHRDRHTLTIQQKMQQRSLESVIFDHEDASTCQGHNIFSRLIMCLECFSERASFCSCRNDESQNRQMPAR